MMILRRIKVSINYVYVTKFDSLKLIDRWGFVYMKLDYTWNGWEILESMSNL